VQTIGRVDAALLEPHAPRLVDAFTRLFQLPLEDAEAWSATMGDTLAASLFGSADFGEEPEDAADVEDWLQQSRDELTPDRIAAAQRLFDAALEAIEGDV